MWHYYFSPDCRLLGLVLSQELLLLLLLQLLSNFPWFKISMFTWNLYVHACYSRMEKNNVFLQLCVWTWPCRWFRDNGSIMLFFLLSTWSCMSLSCLHCADGCPKMALGLLAAYSLVWQFLKKLKRKKVRSWNSLVIIALPLGGRFGNLFDDDPKQWRMYADFIGSAGRFVFTLEFLSYTRIGRYDWIS